MLQFVSMFIGQTGPDPGSNVFSMDQCNLENCIDRGSGKHHLCQIIFKSANKGLIGRFFLKFFLLVAMAFRIMHAIKSLNNLKYHQRVIPAKFG